MLSESIPVDPILQGYSDQLLQSAKWTGVAMIEFRVTPEGKPFLMEINPRFWGSLQLSVDSGADFPSMLVDLYVGKQISPKSYRVGQRLRWYLGDLDRTIMVLKDPNLTKCQKIESVWGFLFTRLASRNEIFRLNDARPAVRELRGYIRDIFT